MFNIIISGIVGIGFALVNQAVLSGFVWFPISIGIPAFIGLTFGLVSGSLATLSTAAFSMTNNESIFREIVPGALGAIAFCGFGIWYLSGFTGVSPVMWWSELASSGAIVFVSITMRELGKARRFSR